MRMWKRRWIRTRWTRKRFAPTSSSGCYHNITRDSLQGIPVPRWPEQRSCCPSLSDIPRRRPHPQCRTSRFDDLHLCHMPNKITKSLAEHHHQKQQMVERRRRLRIPQGHDSYDQHPLTTAAALSTTSPLTRRSPCGDQHHHPRKHQYSFRSVGLFWTVSLSCC